MIKNGNLLLIDFNDSDHRSDSQCSFYTVYRTYYIGGRFDSFIVGLGGRYDCILGTAIPGGRLYSLIFYEHRVRKKRIAFV